MRKSVLFVLLWLPLLPAAVAADNDKPYTARQAEILRDLLTLRPETLPAGEVWMLGKWDTEEGLAALAPFPANPENAAENFFRLEELYPQEKADLDAGGVDTRGVFELLAAAEKGECRLAPSFYPVFDRVTAKQPDFVVLRAYLKALQARAAQSEARGDMREAERCHRAAMLCGRHLTLDRSSALVYMTGLIFKLRGAQGYEAFLRRAGREEADAARRYGERLADFLRFFYWKANVALNEMEAFACLPATIRVAQEDAEACWRKEAVVRLALMRHGVPDLERRTIHRNQEWEYQAEAALSQVAETDPDLSVRRLAVWVVVNLKPEMYEQLEHKF